MPKMGRIGLLTVIALKVGNDEVDDESLLQISSTLNLLLNSNSDLEPFRVRLRPNERGIHKLDSLESFDMFQTEGEQLRGLGFKVHPRWALVPVALSAMLQLHRSWDTLCDIYFRLQTVDTGCRSIRSLHWNSTEAASSIIPERLKKDLSELLLTQY